MNNKVYYIILEDCILLSKRKYSHWQKIQDEYYDNFKASLGPWTLEELISYLEDDFKDENKWPFVKEGLVDFFEGTEMIYCSDR